MGTGLKKCSPPNLSNRSVDTAMSLIGSDEVLLVKIVSLKFYNYIYTKIQCSSERILMVPTLFPFDIQV